MKIPRIVLAGNMSGVGKTSITCAIIYGVKKRGFTVQSFKVGPDYIDPSYLTSVSGRPSRNLDPWLMGISGLVKTFIKNSVADFSVIEGVMGLYDGFSGDSNFSSTHHVASILKTPIILVLDASKTGRSIAATAMGFVNFHKNSRIAGFILNKIGSKKHDELCKMALSPLKIPIIGSIPRDPDFPLESRHLGLVPVSEQKQLQAKITKIAKSMSDFINIDKIIQIGSKVPPLGSVPVERNHKQKTTIAVALDESFNFYYQDNLDALKKEGAKLEFFSPISDLKVPESDGIYLGGGFPEILGNALAKNSNMKKNIKDFAESEKPIYAECGGLMYLTKLIDYGNDKFKMVGLYDSTTKMQRKLKLNYTKASILDNCLVGSSSNTIHGHEFHFSELDSVPQDSKFAYKLSNGFGIKSQKDGLMTYNTLASYMHLHFALPRLARTFVKNCIIQSRR